MKRKILQSLANSIINKIEKATDLKVIDFYYQVGLSLDTLSLNLGIELE